MKLLLELSLRFTARQTQYEPKQDARTEPHAEPGQGRRSGAEPQNPPPSTEQQYRREADYRLRKPNLIGRRV